MLTVEQILENNSDENDIYIATYGKAQFDELMQLLESQGYEWNEGQKPTDCYEDITIDLDKLFNTKKPYKFANTSVVLISLCNNKKILCMVLLPDEQHIRSYTFCFNDEKGTKLIKPYSLFKKEIEQVVDWEKIV